ncbi:hypothetical protein AB5J49_03265 [Streptomyces sp. R28]|uniref:Tetratricopeptide repeat protein n=1 Tax=Streptomyces sp. R28 TaxID=3238628 RepID=A0AB39PSD9_9ACTN
MAIDESLERRDAEIGFALITLAQIHRDRCAPERARPMAERALSLHESCLPAESPAIATDLATLARIRHLRGDHEAPVPLTERALRIDEAAYGPDAPLPAPERSQRRRGAHGSVGRLRRSIEAANWVGRRTIPRRLGYTVANRVFDPELLGTGAPVRDFTGRIKTTANISGPAFRFEPHVKAFGGDLSA